jgi:hypothetical protein
VFASPSCALPSSSLVSSSCQRHSRCADHGSKHTRANVTFKKAPKHKGQPEENLELYE